ncbi:hypothetical protein E2C01_074996 [Portunus trituberculatus]|uniref:Secreted protein n=1 Tax=Portunus trituberculatus TaxID=210409 RepID=A0A5B7IFR3_PORTR|nr:hypothetical protein [Portunus trituberculatus]
MHWCVLCMVISECLVNARLCVGFDNGGEARRPDTVIRWPVCDRHHHHHGHQQPESRCAHLRCRNLLPPRSLASTADHVWRSLSFNQSRVAERRRRLVEPLVACEPRVFLSRQGKVLAASVTKLLRRGPQSGAVAQGCGLRRHDT